MEVVVLESAAAVAHLVTDAVCALLRRRPDAVLGLATGSSTSAVYDELVDRFRRREVSFERAQGLLLDEYVGLPAGHPQRYDAVIRRTFTSHVDLAPGALQGLDGGAVDSEAECRRYERAIAAAGGIDLQLLGIGRDGHLGFNEPGSSLGSRTRLKTLTAATRDDNARFFAPGESVPKHVLTQGLATIGEARHLVLVATGEVKADAVAAAVEGPLTASCPASVLQLHPHATVALDEAAASRLRRLGYYRQTFADKPSWQDI
ncbi:MAG TPA: glucosamine-6-phosphate deaminase [Actinomycetales bacterium]|nr:glucosamine-6-phosphate deaminase [Actinomycetales bacterium]